MIFIAYDVAIVMVWYMSMIGLPRQGFPGPLVSIVMPVYGVEKYLDEAVSDALAQTYRRIEVVLVDDGSSDSCPGKCDGWAAKDDRVRVIHQPNGGLSHARNTGMAAALGDYLYFMDPDDRIEPSLVRTCLDAARRYDADLVMFRFDTIAEDGSPMKSSYRHNEYEEPVELTAEQAIRLQVKGDIDSYFWAFLAPRSTYARQGFSFPEGRKIEDMARICNVIGESTRVVRIPDVLYHYRLRAGSAVHSPSADLTADWMQAAQDRREYIIARYPQLRRFLALQTLNVLGNINYETMRQSIMFGLKLDPESQQQFRQKVNEFLDDLGDGQGDGLLSRRPSEENGSDADAIADDASGRFARLLDRVADSLRDSLRDAKDAVKDTVKDAVAEDADADAVDADVRGGVREALDRLREFFDAHVPESDEESPLRRERGQRRRSAQSAKSSRSSKSAKSVKFASRARRRHRGGRPDSPLA